jgi:5-methyltetrahydropteroyltriglutamate--homocysteine methyltransferase
MASETVHRAENVGSLLRPAWPKDARAKLASGELSLPDFKRVEDRAVDDAIRLYEDVGLDVVTDGEQRRAFFFSTLTEIVDGLGPAASAAPAAMSWHGAEEYRSGDESFSLPVAVIAPMRRNRSLATEEFVYARARTQAPLKATLPSPLCLVALWSASHSREAYADPMEVVEHAARILREEVRELVAVGCTDIQIDAPEIGTLVDPAMRDWYEHAVGVDPERMLGEGIELVNSVAESAAGVRFGIHVCRGNNAGRFLASGGYEAVSARVFPRLNGYHYFMLEYDDHRSGGFEPLRHVPADAVVVLGLISTKIPRLESDEAVIARIEEASRFFPRDQLALSTQCGFASTSEGSNARPVRVANTRRG